MREGASSSLKGSQPGQVCLLSINLILGKVVVLAPIATLHRWCDVFRGCKMLHS